MKGKRLLILGAAFGLAISGCASATRITRMNPLRTEDGEEPAYKLDGTITGGSNGYATESEITQEGVGWMVTGNTTINPWRIGGKNLTNQDRSIYSTSVISSNIASIEVASGTATATVNSLTISVHSSAADAASGSSPIASTSVSTNITSNKVALNKTDSSDWSNKYYRIVYNVTAGGSNSYVQFKSASFYEESSGGPSLASITLNKTSLELNTEDTFQLTASNNDEAIENVVWSSSDDNVASVNNGLVTAIAAGTATITASADGYSNATCSVTVLEKLTVAEALEIIDDLADGETTSEKYSIEGYIIAVTTDWSTQYNNITYTMGDTVNQEENLLTVFRSGVTSDTTGSELKSSDKVKVVGKLTKYVSGSNVTPEVASGCITTLLEAGDLPEPAPTEVTVAEAVEIAGNLASGAQTSLKYIVEGYIIGITTTWSSQSNNITYTMGDAANQTTGLLTIYHSGVDEDTVGSDLAVGDQVSVIGNLKNYNSTLELVNCTTELIEAGSNHPVDVDVDSVATVKTIAEVNAYASADNTIIAKVTGVTDSITNNQFYLVNPDTKESVLVYHAYTDATFQKAGNEYSTKTKETAVTDSIIGHIITVYSVISSYNDTIQLKDALVVDSGNSISVNASISVNDGNMGFATLSATTSIEYGTEIVVSPVPAEGYQVQSVTVERVTGTDTIEAVDGTYKFNAQIKNVVLVTFEEETVIVPVVGVLTLASSVSAGDKVVLACNEASKQYNGPSTTSTIYGLGSDFDGEQPDKNGLLLEVVVGSDEGTFAFKLLSGDNADEYLAWTSGNSLKTSDSLDANSSWKVSFDSDNNATIKNSSDESRVIWWNNSSPRFACYTSNSNKQVQLWKLVTPETYLKSASPVKSLAATESEGTVSGVSITLGATISEETWNAINANWPITAYGLMSARRTSASSKTVIAAYNDGFAVADKRIEVNGAPNFENGSYTFTAKINVSNYNTLFGVAPYIVAGGQLYFLEELDYSVKELAQEYLAAEDYSVLSQDVLNILADN